MADYVKYIRGMVGNKPIILVGACVVLINGAGELLMQKRRDNGSWGLNGGCVELYENTEDAARRELFEETGLTAKSLTLLGVFSGERLRYTYPNGDEVSFVIAAYVCREYYGELAAQESEVEELRFFRLDDLPEDLNPADLAVIDEVKKLTLSARAIIC